MFFQVPRGGGLAPPPWVCPCVHLFRHWGTAQQLLPRRVSFKSFSRAKSRKSQSSFRNFEKLGIFSTLFTKFSIPYLPVLSGQCYHCDVILWYIRPYFIIHVGGLHLSGFHKPPYFFISCWFYRVYDQRNAKKTCAEVLVKFCWDATTRKSWIVRRGKKWPQVLTLTIFKAPVSGD